MNAKLYFVGRFKDGYLLFITHGPFFEEEPARVICDQQEGRKCYSEVIEIEMPFTVLKEGS